MEGLKVEYFIHENFDFILDYSAVARNVEMLNQYYGFFNYACFRNGYTGFNVPRLRVKERNYLVPSIQNQNIFLKNGFPSRVAYYPVPDFYSPAPNNSITDNLYVDFFTSNGLTSKEYFLFPHRPTSEKGSHGILLLAKHFPKENFVFMVSNNPVEDHKKGIKELKQHVISSNLTNIKFVELPLTNLHHYYKRELLRQAKAVLSPFNPLKYKEGFGLANAEAVACGTPILISDSESSTELWRDEIDGMVIPYDDKLWGFKQIIRNFSTYSFSPSNRYTVEKSISNYENIMKEIMESTSNLMIMNK